MNNEQCDKCREPVEACECWLECFMCTELMEVEFDQCSNCKACVECCGCWRNYAEWLEDEYSGCPGIPS